MEKITTIQKTSNLSGPRVVLFFFFFQGHYLRPRVTVLCTHIQLFLVFPLMNFLKSSNSKRTICTLKLCIKNIGHHARLRENDDLPPTRAKPYRKCLHFVNVRALITLKILRSNDAQCNTEESP